ncbi:MAG: thermonuclease family protein [Candidatus Competibacteraceae bacterium]
MKRDILKWVQSFLRKELRNTRRRKRSSPIIIAVLVIAVFAVSRLLEEPKAPLPAKGAELVCTVSKVSDGDTVTTSCPEGKLSVRVYGIDAPEMGQKPWGDESRRRLQELLPNDPIRLAVQDIDRYNRVVAQLYAGNRDVGLEMVRQGHAVVYEQYNRFPSYRQAQTEAKREQRGVWAAPGAQQTPWEWRKLNPR